MLFRDLEIEDLDIIFNLLQEVSPFKPSKATMQSCMAGISSNPLAHGIVAVIENKVTGFGSITAVSRVRGGKVGYIEDVVVARRYRRLGVGSALVKKLVETGRLMGCYKVILESREPERKFYESIGFDVGGKTMKFNFAEKQSF
jgi:ribosomal protein S18 acetylase RimI-like enzyme